MSIWPKFEIVVAFAESAIGRVIGHDGDTPWHLRSDLKRFRSITTAHMHNAVIMGRKTWDSIPAKYRPLPLRRNIILSRQLDLRGVEMRRSGDVRVASSLDEAFEMVEDYYPFVIGGAEIYEQTIDSPQLIRVHQTVVELPVTHPCFDSGVLSYFPPGPTKGRWLVSQFEEGLDEGMRYRYETLKRQHEPRR